MKTNAKDGLALVVPWGQSQEQRFKSRMSAAAALAAQQRDPQVPYYMDPFEMTRELVAGEFKPALPDDVTKAWTVAAYPSTSVFREDVAARKQDAELAFVLRHRFLTPDRPDPQHETLKRAVALSSSEDFRRKRARFYEWQEQIIEDQASDEKAIGILEKLLSDYNAATEKALGDVIAKFAFTTIAVSLALGGAALGGVGAGLAIAGGAGLVEFARFWKFDRKLEIDNGDLNAAAMVYDAQKTLSLR